MNAATRRGFIIFAIIVAVTAIFCVYLPFFGLPKSGLGVALPAISLPAEVLKGNVLPAAFGYDFTNSMTSLIIVDALLILMGLVIFNATYGKRPDEFVPRGFTNFVEVIVEFWYNTARGVLGNFTGRVLPLALTIFFFLLTANWITRLPIYETVGMVSCAEPGNAGYHLTDANASVKVLKVDSPVLGERAGEKATEADTVACEKANPQFAPPKSVALKERCESGALDAATCKKMEEDEAAALKEHGKSDLFVVTPYLRSLATDINMPLALALIVVIAVQIWGIWALGGSYFFKFFNIPALGNMSKNPMGVMDFVVGLIEIISEFSRLISLPFRLLGNLFAGGILFAVMSFLVAFMLPVIFGGLEFFVGAIQAYVFAILTIMYASQAVTAHHGDDHDEHAEHADHSEHSEHAAAPAH